MLDIAGYRAERRAELTAVAQAAVAQVEESGESVALEPMNPFERKVCHDVVAAAGLVSESEGTEPHRHVVVMPAPDETPAAVGEEDAEDSAAPQVAGAAAAEGSVPQDAGESGAAGTSDQE